MYTVNLLHYQLILAPVYWAFPSSGEYTVILSSRPQKEMQKFHDIAILWGRMSHICATSVETLCTSGP